MFITHGTVLSQIFWFLICMSIIILMLNKVFVRKIGKVIADRHNNIQTLKNDIKKFHEQSNMLNQQGIEEELQLYEKLRIENAKIINQFNDNIENSMTEMKNSFISEQLLLQKELREIKQDILQELEKALPELTKKALKKLK